ncbi:MAG: ribbon-helix-helix protein, CopG family [Deltaproteobacteria bacterium]|nr:ribbon-helix-helix protein, CopG family [Deltaproteobacteria bacterium]
MKSSTVNISFNDDLLKQIDRVAEEESRSRSELIREAARGYIERRHRWRQIFHSGKMKTAEQGMVESDIESEIAAYRREKKK